MIRIDWVRRMEAMQLQQLLCMLLSWMNLMLSQEHEVVEVAKEIKVMPELLEIA